MNLEAVIPEARAALGAQRPMFLRAALCHPPLVRCPWL